MSAHMSGEPSRRGNPRKRGGASGCSRDSDDEANDNALLGGGEDRVFEGMDGNEKRLAGGGFFSAGAGAGAAPAPHQPNDDSVLDPPNLAKDEWVSEAELCSLLASKGKLSGHLMKDSGRADFPVEITVVHVADSYAVVYDNTDNHLYVVPYKQGVGEGGLDYCCDTSAIVKLEDSHGYELTDLPQFASDHGFDENAWSKGKPEHVFGVCDNIGQVRMWDATSGKMVLAFQCTKIPGDALSVLVTPNTFAISPTYVVITTAPSDKHTMIYYRPLHWEDIRDHSLVDPSAFVRGHHHRDPALKGHTSTDGVIMSITLTKLTSVTEVVANAPSAPSLFWLTSRSGVGSFNAGLSEFAVAAVPALDWPAFVSPKYNLSGGGIRFVKKGGGVPDEVPVMHKADEDARVKVEVDVKSYLMRIPDWASVPSIHETAVVLLGRFGLDGIPAAVDSLLAVFVAAIGHDAEADPEAFHIDPEILQLADANLIERVVKLTDDQTQLVANIVPLWVDKVCTSAAFHTLETVLSENLPSAVMSPPGSLGIKFGRVLYDYTRFKNQGDPITALPDAHTTPAVFGIWYNKLVDALTLWLKRAQTDSAIVARVRRVSMPPLDAEHRPVSIGVEGARTVSVIHDGIVWTDSLAQRSMPVRVEAAGHGVPLDHGAAVVCLDGILRFVENPTPGADTAVTAVFLRGPDAGSDGIEQTRITENVNPRSMLARIDESTVAVSRYDNSIWFFKVVEVSTSYGAASADGETMPLGVPPEHVPRQNWHVPNEVPGYNEYRRQFEGSPAEAAVVLGSEAAAAAPGPGELDMEPIFEEMASAKAADAAGVDPAIVDGIVSYDDDPAEEANYEPGGGAEIPGDASFVERVTEDAIADLAASDAKYKWATEPPEEDIGRAAFVAQYVVEPEDCFKPIVAQMMGPGVAEGGMELEEGGAAAAAAGPAPMEPE